MDVTIVTAMNAKIYEKTGRQMLESVRWHWPNYPIRVYIELDGSRPLDNWHAILAPLNITAVSSGTDGMHKFTRLADKRGVPRGGNFRKDVRRFAFKSFAILDAADEVDGRLIWIDADTKAFADVSQEQVDLWMPENKAVTFLGRSDTYTETGFLMLRVNDPDVREMLATWRAVYEKGGIFLLKEWHDCWVFDRCREGCIPECKENNLSPWGKGYDHVFVNSELGKYMDHMKGPRKKRGKSHESDLVTGRVPDEFRRYVAE